MIEALNVQYDGDNKSHKDRALRGLAAAVFVNALQIELSGGWEPGNKSFLEGRGLFDHWARCLDFEPETLRDKIKQVLKGGHSIGTYRKMFIEYQQDTAGQGIHGPFSQEQGALPGCYQPKLT